MEKKVPGETAVDVASGDVELQGYDEHATKKLLRKLDWHIIPFMSLIYLSVSLVFYRESDHLTLYLGFAFSTAPTSATPASTTSSKISNSMVYSTMTALRYSSHSISQQRSPRI